MREHPLIWENTPSQRGHFGSKRQIQEWDYTCRWTRGTAVLAQWSNVCWIPPLVSPVWRNVMWGNPANVGPLCENGGTTSPSTRIIPFLDLPFRTKMASLGWRIFPYERMLSHTSLVKVTLRFIGFFLPNNTK